MDGRGEKGSLLPHTFQLLCTCVVLVDDGDESGHTVPETSVASRLVLTGQPDPGLHGTGKAGWCGLVSDVLFEDFEFAGVLLFVAVEFD